MAGAPILLEKIAKHRPRVVCFVGLGIYKTFQKYLARNVSKPEQSQLSLPQRRRGHKTPPTREQGGLKPYKLVHLNQFGSCECSVFGFFPLSIKAHAREAPLAPSSSKVEMLEQHQALPSALTVSFLTRSTA